MLIPNSTTSQIFSTPCFFRRTYKICSGCGLLGRQDNLRTTHFTFCQPKLLDGENGFLKVGEQPVRNSEDVEMILRLVGSGATSSAIDGHGSEDIGCSILESETDDQKCD